MSNDELIAKAVEHLHKVERILDRSEKVSPEVRRLKVDEMQKHTLQEAVFIRFEAHDNRGCIEVVMDSQTGEILDNKFIPPKKDDDKLV
jgi:hypothetical protein